MVKTIKKLAAENNEKRKLLNDSNKKYYEDFLSYVRASFFKDERATEEVLMEMLDHLLIAQEEGKSAEAVFGKNPQALADEVVESLPSEPFQFLFTFGIELILTLFAYYALVMGIVGAIFENEKTIYLGNLFILAVGLVATLALLIYVMMTQMKKHIYKKGKKKKIVLPVFFVLFFGSMAIKFATMYMPKMGRAIELGQFGILSIACLLLLITFIMKKIREQR